MENSVLATSCVTLPLVHKTVCAGLPNPGSTLISRPAFFGIQLFSERAFAWFSIIILVLSVVMVRVWRDKGIARRLIAVRDNEVGAGSAGTPVVRTKLLAFAISGFMAGYAGVMFAYGSERFSNTTFDPTFSILVVSMVVIGGLDSITGALLGADLSDRLAGSFGGNADIQFLTSGLGLLAFVLYLPGGMAEVLHRFGDLVALGVSKIRDRAGGTPTPLAESATVSPVPQQESEPAREAVAGVLPSASS